ncbi:TRAP transporter substrate-binding protein DctP [Brevibacterium salitolerans]|uniref:TRAP-type C4-dicarboxylate transport system, substrate-binding protein n=1 Tax=Brevibacterium salitolerans TaxID=1403566 RepID=A0ABP5I4Y3_9MICO
MKISAQIAAAAAAVLTFSGCAGGIGKEANTLTLGFAHVVGEDSALGEAAKAMVAAIEEEYDGTVETEYYWASALAGGPELLHAVGDGRTELANSPAAYSANELPAATWTDTLPALAGPAPLATAMAGSAAHTQLFREPLLTEEYAAQGVTPLGVLIPDYFYMVCNTPVESAEDARGLQVRAGSPTHTRELEALGMTPVSIEWGETYDALSRGTIDCTLTSLSGAVDLGLYENAKHVAMVPFAPTVLPVLMNTDALESLDPDMQDFMRTEAVAAYLRGYMKAGIADNQELYAEGGALAEDGDVTVTQPGELIAELDEFRAAELEELPGKAPESVEDPAAVIEDYTADMAQWRARFSELSGIPEDGYATPEETIAGVESVTDPDALVDSFVDEFSAEALTPSAD